MSTTDPSLSASTSLSAGSNISLKATINKDGHTVCHVDCNGQRAKLVFTGTDVILDVHDPPVEGA